MIKRYVAIVLFWCLAGYAIAANSPVTILESATNQMLTALTQNKATIKSNPTYVENLARQILLPHVDTVSMSKLALGRDGWMQATPAQQQQFIQQFTTLMIRTYSTALASYSNQTVQYFPVRGGTDGKSIVQVDSKILQPGGPSIPVAYKLILRGNDWKVFDLSVDGVSMVQSFRSQFAPALKQGGMPALLSAMAKKNGSRSA